MLGTGPANPFLSNRLLDTKNMSKIMIKTIIGEKQVSLIWRYLQYFELDNASNLRRNWACELIAIEQSDKNEEII
jgi:hypothetical protein